jgi:homocysteine S-methyltransferase
MNYPLILDGATGTELGRRGVSIKLPLWSASAIRDNPEILQNIHKDYINAGADIITANTFRTDTRTFTKAGLTRNDARLYTQKAVSITGSAIKSAQVKRKIWIAGSISPLEDCYYPEYSPDYKTAFKEHYEKAFWLMEAGVDFILIETMNTFHEALAATKASLETKLPVVTSFILDNNGNIFNGDDLLTAYYQLEDLGISGFSINCTHHSVITEVLKKHINNFTLPIIVYANAGIYVKTIGWQSDFLFTPESYAKITENWISMGVKIVGGCCGTTPKHIKKIYDTIKADN